ncbi:UDP-glucose:Glyco protein glucosyltransferase-domain-containing protein, partial [Endogone sp. FLAS-F59071]
RIAVGNESTAYYQFGAIIDPLSEFAQKTAAVLEVCCMMKIYNILYIGVIALSKVDGVYIEIYLNPLQSLKELPLKRFYRYVFDEELHFDATGQIERPSAYFTNVPEDPLLTLGMDVISPWLVRPVVADQDLDNLRLANLDAKQRAKGVTAVFELRNILIEGHCRDTTINGPPRGLQFVLGTASYPALVDTIVMANLGYLQLKANPGVFELSLREGRSKEIYDIESVGSEGWLSRSVEEIGYDVVLNTFEGVVIYPRVSRKPGKEKDNLLEDTTETEDTEDAGIWSSIKSSLILLLPGTGFGALKNRSRLRRRRIKPKSTSSQ